MTDNHLIVAPPITIELTPAERDRLVNACRQAAAVFDNDGFAAALGVGSSEAEAYRALAWKLREV